MRSLAEERGSLRQQVQQLSEENEDRKGLLATSAASLWGDHASTLILNQLEQDVDGSDDRVITVQ